MNATHIVCPSCNARNRVPADRLGDNPVCGRCQQPVLPARPIARDDTNLDRYLQGTDLPVVIDFWAAWCGPCQMMAPHFAQAAARDPRIRFVKVDTEAAPQAAARWQIRSIPTLALTRNGKEIARVSGAMQEAQLRAWIAQHVDQVP